MGLQGIVCNRGVYRIVSGRSKEMQKRRRKKESFL
jgi:hypothetical protein